MCNQTGKFNPLPFDVIYYIFGFLQRTDQIAWKLTSNFYYSILIRNSMDLNQEVNLYTKTIDELDYAYKNNLSYFKIERFPNIGSNFDILNKYAIMINLIEFDFNAVFDVYPGEYRIICLTNVSGYIINIKFINSTNNIVGETSHKPESNQIKVQFESKGKIKVNCREIGKLKNLKTIQYIMCIPEYYWKKIVNHVEWKKQILMTNDGIEGRKMIRYFN